jgi:hypothetical protein
MLSYLNITIFVKSEKASVKCDSVKKCIDHILSTNNRYIYCQ